MRTPEQAVFLQPSQIAANGFGGDVQLGGQFGDIHLSVPAGQRDDLMLSLLPIHRAPLVQINRGLFVTPEKRVARITIQAS
ncbi:hypothetical protein GCM10010172_41950 [Paractinoplanes ferrugineus]|uniref:Uncharacterized protein n=1 Tax=Paractinoplanes ferrugineus TaxID=113564 RepID=A0A919ML54_9ACTN|nr:hypothetical protein Afe05nite_83100 [Actinoplanes ferrugineus]